MIHKRLKKLANFALDTIRDNILSGSNFMEYTNGFIGNPVSMEDVLQVFETLAPMGGCSINRNYQPGKALLEFPVYGVSYIFDLKNFEQVA